MTRYKLSPFGNYAAAAAFYAVAIAGAVIAFPHIDDYADADSSMNQHRADNLLEDLREAAITEAQKRAAHDPHALIQNGDIPKPKPF